MRRPFIRQDREGRPPYAFDTIGCRAGLLVGINGEQDTCCLKIDGEYLDLPFNYILFLTDKNVEDSFTELELVNNMRDVRYDKNYILIHEDQNYLVPLRRQGHTFYQTTFKESQSDYRKFLVFIERAIASKKLYEPVKNKSIINEQQISLDL